MDALITAKMDSALKISTPEISNAKSDNSFIQNIPEISRYSLAEDADDKARDMDYHIELITKEDQPMVIKFLRRFFFRDEPLNECIQLIPTGENSTCVELEEYSTSAIDDNISLKAVTSSGTIIGVCLNGVMGPPTEGVPDYVTNCKNPKFKKIVTLLHHVDKQSNVSGRYPNKKVMELRIISVDINWRGKGVSKMLFDKSLKLAEQHGFDILRVDCSSMFSSKLCEKFGLHKIYELNYADYLDAEGNPVFNPASPHYQMRTYIRHLK